jgi:hypothetical protein
LPADSLAWTVPIAARAVIAESKCREGIRNVNVPDVPLFVEEERTNPPASAATS